MAIQGHLLFCFDVDEKPFGDYKLRHNNFGLIYEISKDIDRKKQKWQFLTTLLSFDAPTQRTPTNIGVTLISSQTTPCPEKKSGVFQT